MVTSPQVSWLFFCVARSTRMTQIWALRSRLEKQPTDLRRRHHYMRDGTLEPNSGGGFFGPQNIILYKSSPKLVCNGSPSTILNVRCPSACLSARRNIAF